MATFAPLSVISSNSVPKIFPNHLGIRVSVLGQREISSVHLNHGGRSRLRRLNAGLSEIEPDLNEDPVDRWETNSVSAEDFKYGKYDEHHTYYEGEQEKGTFWGAIADDIAAVEPPSGFQGFISWLFLPAVAAAMYFNVPGEYLFIGAAVFTVVFCVIEMDKPDKPHNFEPQIYNMERGARDKLINDYNTMSIWDFNEKYGDLWDFTVKKDDIMKRKKIQLLKCAIPCYKVCNKIWCFIDPRLIVLCLECSPRKLMSYCVPSPTYMLYSTYRKRGHEILTVQENNSKAVI